MNRAKFREKVSGNYIALPTPFHDDFSLDLASLRRLVRRQIEAGYCTGNGVLLAGGAAGEFSVLDMDERKQLAQAVVEEAAGDISVVVGVQDTSTLRIQELAQFAQEIGADGIQISPPYYEPPTAEDYFELLQSVSDAADIPMIVYNTWWTGTGVSLEHEQIARLLEISNVGAVKWSASDHSTYESVLRDFAGKVPIVDNQLSEVWSHMLGAVGFTSHLPLAWPGWGLKLWQVLQSQDYMAATEMLSRFRIPYYRLFYKAYAYSGSEGHFDKAVLDLVGFPVGPPRPPGRTLPPSLCDEIRQMLIEADVPNVAGVEKGDGQQVSVG